MEIKKCIEIKRLYNKHFPDNNLQDLDILVQEVTMRTVTGFFIRDNKEGKESGKKRNKTDKIGLIIGNLVILERETR